MEDVPEVRGLPLGSLEDRDLTLAYQRGEDGAYQAIYDRYSGRVHSVCRRMLGNSQDAQDAAQESFLRVYQALGRFNGRYQLGPWITRIATNVCLDHLRARSRRPKDVVPLEIAELEAHEDAEGDAPDEIVIRKSETRRVRRVLESLPPMHRAAIVLRDFEGLSYQEVAIALGITDCQVKALIHRARQGFKRSWTSIALGAILPARIFQRARKIGTAKPSGTHTSSMQHLAESFTATTAPAASSCSAAFSQCGQFVADKLAPAVTAVALGAASLAIPAREEPAPPRTESQVSDESVQLAAVERSGQIRDAVRGSVSARQPRPTTDDAGSGEGSGSEVPQAGGSPPSPAPTASPAPAASPTPPPAAAPTSAPPVTNSDGGSGGSQAPPPKAPFTAAVGFNNAGPSSSPSSNRVTVGCLTRVFDQTLVTTVADGSATYTGELLLRASSNGTWLRLSFDHAARTFTYTSWGAQPVASWVVGDRSAQLTVTGDYGPAYGTNPESFGLPGHGSFKADLVLDCSTNSVTSETVTFTES